MRTRRDLREAYAAALLTKYVSSHDWWIRGPAAIAIQLNAWGFRTWHKNTLVSADHVKRWSQARRIPTRLAGAHRAYTCSALTLIAWLHGPQRCVNWPRPPRNPPSTPGGSTG